jgi:hypothetical protein
MHTRGCFTLALQLELYTLKKLEDEPQQEMHFRSLLSESLVGNLYLYIDLSLNVLFLINPYSF